MIPLKMLGTCRGLLKSLILATLLLTIVFCTFAGSTSQGTKQLQAGAATSNITPSLAQNSPIVGERSQRSSGRNYIHDEFHVRCLVLDDGETRLGIAVVDNIGIPRYVLDEAKRLTEERVDLASDQILISATHTHSGPSARGSGPLAEAAHKGLAEQPLDSYQSFVVDRIVDGFQNAISRLEPARIGWSKGSLPEEVFNRRWFMKPGTSLPNPFGGTDQVRMNPGVGNPNILKPAGPTDPEICFLSVQSVEGRPIALLANYSLHYVGGVPRGHYSADYFAVFSRRMAELLDASQLTPPFVAIMSNGTSGNINNINYRGGQQKYPPYGRMDLVATKAAAEVFRAYQDVQHRDWVPLAMAQADLPLATRQPSPELLARARKIMANPSEYPQERLPSPRALVAYADRTIGMTEYAPQITVPLQAIRIGDLAIATVPFETFVETGLEIKEKSPFQQTFTVSLANGSYGYLPTPEHHELGGYETWLGTSRFEVEASTKITTRLLEMLEELSRKSPES